MGKIEVVYLNPGFDPPDPRYPLGFAPASDRIEKRKAEGGRRKAEGKRQGKRMEMTEIGVVVVIVVVIVFGK